MLRSPIPALLMFVALAMPVLGALPPDMRLNAYRKELERFRSEYGGGRALPAVRFFLFGMGHRSKMLYRDGRLVETPSGKEIAKWDVERDWILPDEYKVEIETKDGGKVIITEDEEAVWLEKGDERTEIKGTRSPLQLPTFSGFTYSRVLRVLHQELLINITPKGPVPNFYVYPKPWYRDAAMMALAFRETGNTGVLEDWVHGLREPFDQNNGGAKEPDNLGQALFLISVAGTPDHPLVPKVLAEIPNFEKQSPEGKYITGQTDFAEHPVFQTKWLKFGLRSLELPDPYEIPAIHDSYSALFWMDYQENHVPGDNSEDRNHYPYLGWACDHFHGLKRSPIGDQDYPLTWESEASHADYSGIRALDPVYVDRKIATPHTWHAAEAFLFLHKRMRER